MISVMHRKMSILVCLVLSVSGGVQILYAQISFTGQLRTRTEVRNGLGNLVPQDSKAASFTSQRTRLSLGYKWDRVLLGVSVQDIRVWGQDASSITVADGSRLSLHEGWAEMLLADKSDTTRKAFIDNLSLKIGRQELIYDDSRLIGNLDWLQQARRHDMALLKTQHHGWQMDIGLAYNQNSDAFGITGSSYLPGNLPSYVRNSAGVLVTIPAGIVPLAAGGNISNNSSVKGMPVYLNPPGTNGATQQYKSFVSVYISKKIRHTKFSLLFLNDNFGRYRIDSVGTASQGYVYGRRFAKTGTTDEYDYSGTSKRYTYGLMIQQVIKDDAGFGKLDIQAAYYKQTGTDRDAVVMDAFHYTIAVSWQRKQLGLTAGYDLLSGDDAVSASGNNNRFDPLYGTPHKFWGYMDYFYAGTGSPAGGLRNAYLKTKFTAKKVSASMDLHFFSLHRDMKKADGTVIDKKLGTEIDWQFSYAMNRFTNIELGYSMMQATASMPFAKAQAVSDIAAAAFRKSANWLYIMIRFSPDLLYRKT
jgi:hypothetical protein